MGGARSQPSSSFANRVEQIFRFEAGVYSDVAADGRAWLQSLVIVTVWPLICSSLLALAFLFVVVFGMPADDPDQVLFLSLLSLSVVIIAALSSLFTTVTAAILVRIAATPFGVSARRFGVWFRVLGFAQAPLVVLGVIPVIGLLLGLVYVLATSMACVHGMCRLPVWQSVLIWMLGVVLPVVVLSAVAVVAGLPLLLYLVAASDFLAM